MKLFSIMGTAFDNYDNTVRNYLARTFNELGMQYTHSQLFGIIFDGIKGIMQNAMFYIEDALNEQNIFTAIRRNSIFSLAKLSGYEPYYGSAATGTILARVIVNNGLDNKSTKIYIPNYSRIVDTNTGLSYCILLPSAVYVIDVSKPISIHEFNVVQGYRDMINYIAKGYNWETIHANTNELFDKQHLHVTVDGEEWDQCPTLYDMTEMGKQYVLTIGFNNTFDIMFGNGTYGHPLMEGQTVQVSYIKHNGSTGNILPNTKTVFAFMNKMFDSLGNTIEANNYIQMKMSTCISGGTNSDSTDFIRQMIGYNSRSLVLASENNFKLFFKRFSFVGYVNCWSEKNTMCVTASCLRNTINEISSIDEYYNMDIKDLLLTDEQKTMIQTTLDNSKRTFAGVNIKFQDPIIRRFAFIFYVKPDSIYNKDYIKEYIRTTMASYFMNKFEDSQFIAKSDIIKMLIDGCENIKSVDLDIISELAEQTYYNGYYDKYELKLINGIYKYVPKRVIYEYGSTPGLDIYGNISLESKLEVPVLQGKFKFYPNKDDDKSKNLQNTIMMETVQIYFT